MTATAGTADATTAGGATEADGGTTEADGGTTEADKGSGETNTRRKGGSPETDGRPGRSTDSYFKQHYGDVLSGKYPFHAV